MSKPHWFSIHLSTTRAGKTLHFFPHWRQMKGRKTKTKIHPPTPGTFATKRRSRARRRRAGQELCSYPTLHLQPERGTGCKGIWVPHPTGKPSLSQSKKATQKDIQTLEEAVDQWKIVSTLDTAGSSSAPAHKPTRTLTACNAPGTLQTRLQSKGSRWAIPKLLCRLQRKRKSEDHKHEGKKKKEKAQIHGRGKLQGGTREARTMKGKQEETEGRMTNRGGGTGGPGWLQIHAVHIDKAMLWEA